MSDVSLILPENTNEPVLYLTPFVVTRIVYELIKTFMVNNSPEKCGIQLAQTFDPDPTKSSIFLDMSYNWKADKASKVPAIYVQRGQVQLKSPTMGQVIKVSEFSGAEHRKVISTMPIIVSCVAAEPLAVVENLAEYVKQPLLYFRKEVEIDFGIRRLMLDSITPPKLVMEGKNNFYVDLEITAVFDDDYRITKDSMKIRRIGVELFDQLAHPLQSFVV